jgi:hypothetical protein
MQVMALAEALADTRGPDGAVSLHDLQARLSRAGLEELARAVASLARRVNGGKGSGPAPDKHPWM